MSHKSLPATETIQSGPTKLIASGVLVLEAAIATLVLSTFAGTSLPLYSMQVQTIRPTAVRPLTSPQNQLLSVRLPMKPEHQSLIDANR
ncbi:MAG: hypothetical protein NW220_22420 [Leptolyngbyaceae cyanobacterium bins.349]|nr:hypothetical protein [Leptolyngbyaceae cyanobacterium bins.349]